MIILILKGSVDTFPKGSTRTLVLNKCFFYLRLNPRSTQFTAVKRREFVFQVFIRIKRSEPWTSVCSEKGEKTESRMYFITLKTFYTGSTALTI
jgi:hypothetical protein